MRKIGKKTKISFVLVLLTVSISLFGVAGWNKYTGDIAYDLEKKHQTPPYMSHLTFIGKYAVKGTLHGIGNTTTVTTNPYTHMTLVNTTITQITIPNATLVISFYAKFTSPEAFAVDNNINYTIKASVYPVSNIKEFYFVLDSSVNHFYQNKTNVDYLMQQANETGELIKLKRENATYFTKINGNWTDQIEDRVSFFSIIVDDQNNKRVSEKTPDFLTIASHRDILQANTELDTQRQDLQSLQTNTSIITLTWVIIALIPLGFCIEIAIHGFIIKDGDTTISLDIHSKSLVSFRVKFRAFFLYVLSLVLSPFRRE